MEAHQRQKPCTFPQAYNQTSTKCWTCKRNLKSRMDIWLSQDASSTLGLGSPTTLRMSMKLKPESKKHKLRWAHSNLFSNANTSIWQWNAVYTWQSQWTQCYGDVNHRAWQKTLGNNCFHSITKASTLFSQSTCQWLKCTESQTLPSDTGPATFHVSWILPPSDNWSGLGKLSECQKAKSQSNFSCHGQSIQENLQETRMPKQFTK